LRTSAGFSSGSRKACALTVVKEGQTKRERDRERERERERARERKREREREREREERDMSFPEALEFR